MAVAPAAELLWNFPQPHRWIGDTKFSSNTLLLAICIKDRVSVYEVDTGKEWSLVTLGYPSVLQFGPDDTLLAAGTGQGTVYLMDVLNKVLKFTLNGHTTYVRALAFSLDGSALYSGSQDATVRSWDVATGAMISSVPIHFDSAGWLGSNLRAIAIAPSSQLFASSWFDQTNQLRISELSSGTIIRRVHTGETFETITLSLDGKLCVGGGFDGRVTHIKLPQAAEENPEIVVYRGHVVPSGYYHNPCVIDNVVVSSDGLWVISSSKGHIHFTRPMTKNAHFTFSLGENEAAIWRFDFLPSKNLFVGAVSDGIVRVWSVNPSARNTISLPPTPPRPQADVDDDFDDFYDPYPWKD